MNEWSLLLLLDSWVVGGDEVISEKWPNMPRASHYIIQKKKFSKKKSPKKLDQGFYNPRTLTPNINIYT